MEELGESLQEGYNILCISLSRCYFANAALTLLPCICLTLQENGRMLLPLDQALLERIMEIDRSHPYPRQGNSAQDRLAPPTSPDTSDPYPRQGNSDQDCLAPPTTPILDPALRWSVVKSRTKKVWVWWWSHTHITMAVVINSVCCHVLCPKLRSVIMKREWLMHLTIYVACMRVLNSWSATAYFKMEWQ